MNQWEHGVVPVQPEIAMLTVSRANSDTWQTLQSSGPKSRRNKMQTCYCASAYAMAKETGLQDLGKRQKSPRQEASARRKEMAGPKSRDRLTSLRASRPNAWKDSRKGANRGRGPFDVPHNKNLG